MKFWYFLTDVRFEQNEGKPDCMMEMSLSTYKIARPDRLGDRG